MPNPNVGAPSELTAFPSRREDLRVALVEHRARGERDAVDAAHRLEQRLHRPAGSAAPRRRSRCRALRPVTTASRPGVRLREEGRERAVDRVREDVGAADHRDAEDDRDRGQDGAELAAREAA